MLENVPESRRLDTDPVYWCDNIFPHGKAPEASKIVASVFSATTAGHIGLIAIRFQPEYSAHSNMSRATACILLLGISYSPGAAS